MIIYPSTNLPDESDSQVNILMTQSHRACLADFGLATTKDSMSFAVTSGAISRAGGTLRWQAPELWEPDSNDTSCENSLASDIYAYGCVCYEVVYMIILNLRTVSYCVTDIFGPGAFPQCEE